MSLLTAIISMTEVVLSKSTLITSNYSSFVKNTASHKSLNMNHAYDGSAIAVQDGTVFIYGSIHFIAIVGIMVEQCVWKCLFSKQQCKDD